MSALRVRYCKLVRDSHQEKAISYPLLFWLFVVGSLLGTVCEGVWHFLHHGVWAKRVATLWGPFCIIYGVGAVVMYMLAVKLQHRKLAVQFLCFALTGSAVEYLCGLFQEVCFGTISWDYSRHTFNLGGRISLRMTVLWGVMGLAMMYVLLPVILRAFNRARLCQRPVLCRLMTVFMCINLLMTSAALMRWEKRTQEPALTANNAIERYLDARWPDERLQERFPNMRFVHVP